MISHEEADKARKIMRENKPDSKAYKEAHEKLIRARQERINRPIKII